MVVPPSRATAYGRIGDVPFNKVVGPVRAPNAAFYRAGPGSAGAAYIGLDYIEGASVSINRHTDTTSYSVKPNTGSGATSINGMLDIGSAVAGDSFTVIAWGR
jgi:hypothetical protein